MKNYVADWGQEVGPTISNMITLAKEINGNVRSRFNGVKIKVTPSSDSNDVEAGWQKEYNRRRREYRDTSEIISPDLIALKELSAMKVFYDNHLAYVASLYPGAPKYKIKAIAVDSISGVSGDISEEVYQKWEKFLRKLPQLK